MIPRIGIAGITGRMGQLLQEEVVNAGAVLSGGTSRAEPDLADLAAQSDLIIDFTAPATIARHADRLAAAGIPWILGTTGLRPEDVSAIAVAAGKIPVIAAPNFSPGVNLILALAERLAVALPAATHDAEVLEMHHRQKIDAPSGTALALGRAIASGRGQKLDDVLVHARHGAAAPRKTGEIGFASLRGGQLPGSHTALFTAGAEQITLTHHAFDRRIFATGAVRAALWLRGKPPGLYTMRDVLGLN